MNDLEDTVLNLPPCSLQLREYMGVRQVYDPLRHRWIAYTPEERVRQRFVGYLIKDLLYPGGRIGNEVSIALNGTRKRCDTVIYDGNGLPLAVIEYKAPGVSINRAVFDQILRYSLVLGNRFIFVSNGMEHYCAQINRGINPSLVFLNSIPAYTDLSKL